MSNHCSVCDDPINDPVEQHANYVRSPRFAEVEPTEVTYGLTPTPRGRAELDRLDEAFPDRDRRALAGEAMQADPGTEREGVDFSLDPTLFEEVEVDSPMVANDPDTDVLLTFSRVEEREAEKTAVVCPDCTDPEQDTLIWGPDA